jgi:hypothetical protein
MCAQHYWNEGSMPSSALLFLFNEDNSKSTKMYGSQKEKRANHHTGGRENSSTPVRKEMCYIFDFTSFSGPVFFWPHLFSGPIFFLAPSFFWPHLFSGPIFFLAPSFFWPHLFSGPIFFFSFHLSVLFVALPSNTFNIPYNKISSHIPQISSLRSQQASLRDSRRSISRSPGQIGRYVPLVSLRRRIGLQRQVNI